MITGPGPVRSARWRWPILALALLVLNVSLAFRSRWPTPAVSWAGDVSIEAALCIALLLVLGRGGREVSRSALSGLTGLWLLLILGRYVDVTTPALLGREINLFWDVRFAADVAAMFARAAPAAMIALLGVAIVALAALGYRVVRWTLGRVATGATRRDERRVLAGIAAAALALFAVQRTLDGWPGRPSFARPVVETLGRQARLAVLALGRQSAHDEPPGALASDLSLVQGADVLLVFMESYGAVSWQRPAFVDRLSDSRARLASSVAQAGLEVVSAYVESPTFGGSSWFAHISLLSGIEVRDPNANALLMAEKRDTMVTAFARRGYRTIAVMPGLWQRWPEGAFYGFEDIYGGQRLEYHGPQFGWWAIPDQFAFAQLGALELDRDDRRPVLAFFPTVSTHAPFSPTPPYQPDWRRVLTLEPFDHDDVLRRFDEQPDWLNLSPSYAEAVSYAHQVLAGFFEQPRGRDVVVVLIGDHQPPALVTGEGAPWDVPVHVISRRDQILGRLRARGFRAGLEPRGASIARTHQLLTLLLDSFGNRAAAAEGPDGPVDPTDSAGDAGAEGHSRQGRRRPALR
jgi:hypothetical protein